MKMIRIMENMDTAYLKQLEYKIASGLSLNNDEITYFLESLIYKVRKMLGLDNPYFEYKCDLAQSIICHYLNDLKVINYPNITLKAINDYVVGHSFVVAVFDVLGKKVNYLLDPTYIQFFKEENCSFDKYIIISGNVVRTPDPGYFIDREDRKVIDEFNYNGFGVLTEDLARIYGNSFYNTKTMVRSMEKRELKGYVYINSFLKGREKLSKSREELLKDGYYLDFDDLKIVK